MKIEIEGQGQQFTVTIDGGQPQSVQSAQEALSLVEQALGTEEEESDLGSEQNGVAPPVVDRSNQQAAWDEEARKSV